MNERAIFLIDESLEGLRDFQRATVVAVCKRLQGEKFEATPEQDWPLVSSSDENAWQDAQNQLESGYQKLTAKIMELSDDDLEQLIVPGKPYNLYFMIHGVIQHNLFHAGQIALLKKA